MNDDYLKLRKIGLDDGQINRLHNLCLAHFKGVTHIRQVVNKHFVRMEFGENEKGQLQARSIHWYEICMRILPERMNVNPLAMVVSNTHTHPVDYLHKIHEERRRKKLTNNSITN